MGNKEVIYFVPRRGIVRRFNSMTNCAKSFGYTVKNISLVVNTGNEIYNSTLKKNGKLYTKKIYYTEVLKI